MLWSQSRSPNFFKNWRQYHAEINKLAKECNLRWRANALRHSFASYHLAQFHYREVVTPEAAGRYWSIFAS
jgi:hypothetical protein